VTILAFPQGFLISVFTRELQNESPPKQKFLLLNLLHTPVAKGYHMGERLFKNRDYTRQERGFISKHPAFYTKHSVKHIFITHNLGAPHRAHTQEEHPPRGDIFYSQSVLADNKTL